MRRAISEFVQTHTEFLDLLHIHRGFCDPYRPPNPLPIVVILPYTPDIKRNVAPHSLKEI